MENTQTSTLNEITDFVQTATTNQNYEYTTDIFSEDVIEDHDHYEPIISTDTLITDIPKFVTTASGTGNFVLTVKKTNDDFEYGCGWVNSHTHKHIWMNYQYDYSDALMEAYIYAIKEGWIDIEEC